MNRETISLRVYPVNLLHLLHSAVKNIAKKEKKQKSEQIKEGRVWWAGGRAVLLLHVLSTAIWKHKTLKIKNIMKIWGWIIPLASIIAKTTCYD